MHSEKRRIDGAHGGPLASRRQQAMTDEKNRKEPTLGERIEDLVRELIESLESLVAPQPALVPVPARGRRPYPPRR